MVVIIKRTIKLLPAILIFWLSSGLLAQIKIIEDTVVLRYLTKGAGYIFNCEFARAENIYDSIFNRIPGHPVVPFYKGMIYYWKYYPLPTDGPEAAAFMENMDTVIERSNRILQNNHDDIEATFFVLASKSLLTLYYDDNGVSSKSILYIRSIYRNIVKGFNMQEYFKEFYFFTGLYNYYIEAYPDAHPIYSPLKLLFKPGNKKAGLTMLDYAFRNSIFMKAESAFFLSIIHLGFENNPLMATYYMKEIFKAYPNNAFFLARYAEMLLVNEEYDAAKPLIDSLFLLDEYNVMKAYIYRGIYQEFRNKDPEKARNDYLKGLELSEPYGPLAEYETSYSYIGLSRYYRDIGDMEKARKYYKMARDSNPYPYLYKNY